ncbi:MAG TPA: adenylate/guanylate cyclase domain-containing protein [Longimicrobiales bacterium]|nr:adenylate/guanylate cyclase domain-containing protein [Longimicrobiales bacterium]
MQCPRCQHPNASRASFCGACGSRLTVSCTRCHHGNPPTASFCNACGGPLPDALAREDLTGRLLTSRDALEGERKHVTILFADLKGSLEMVAERDPEEARALLDPVLERLIHSVQRFEGTVNQVMGDGIMALFGAPLSQEDHALRACYAALQMQESVNQYAAEVRGRRGAEPQIRVGLNSGEVVVRSVGSDLRMDYTAVGESTHLAARMEQMAPPGAIFMTASTFRLVENYVEVGAIGSVSIKGLSTPAEVYELKSIMAPRSRLQVSLARGLTPFVGRHSELRVLDDALHRAAAGRGQVAAIVGEPGVGKSRLLWEFLRSGALEGWLVLEAGGLPYGKHASYAPIVTLLRAYFGLVASDAVSARARMVETLGPDAAAEFLAPLLAILDLPVQEERWTKLTDDQRRRRTLDAVKYLVSRRSHETPVCVCVEDLHWIDAETQAVLDALVDVVPSCRLLLLVTYRPEYEHTWGTKTYYGKVNVHPLSATGAQTVLDALLGSAPRLAPLKQVLASRTDGNPFFLEESVRHLVDTGVLRGERGAYRLDTAADVPDLRHLPDTVQSVLAARIDRLLPEDKRVLQAASAVGKDVPRALLAAIVDPGEHDLDASLARLQARELLYEGGFFPEVEYSFTHTLTLDVTYGTLVRDRRRTLDARIVAAIEQLYPMRPAEQLNRLAHHALRGEMWDKAVVYCRDAGARAFSRSAHRTAVAYFDQTLAALGHLPSSREATELAIDVRLDLRYALSPLGEYRRLLETLTEAQRLAEHLDDSRRLGKISSFLCNYFSIRFDFPRAVEHGTRALAVATALDDVGLSAVTNAHLALTYFGWGQYQRSVDAGTCVTALKGDLEQERFGMVMPVAVFGRSVASWSLAELGDFAGGRRIAEEALAIAESLGHPHSTIFACIGLGTVDLRRGELPAAIAVLERAYNLWQTVDLPAVLLEFATPLASAYAQSGRAEEAERLLELAVARALLLRHRIGNVLRSGGMAEALLAAGRIEDALPAAQLYVELTRAVNARGHHAWALHLLGEVLARREPAALDEALSVLSSALTSAEELDMRPLQARSYLSLGRAHRLAGARADAESALTSALRILHALGMRSWAADADRELLTLRH